MTPPTLSREAVPASLGLSDAYGQRVPEEQPGGAGFRAAVTLLVGVSTGLVAYRQGGYGISLRSAIGVVAWWTVAAVLLLGWPRGRANFSQAVAVLSLVVLGLWSLLSVLWAPSVELAVDASSLVGMYAGVAAATCLLMRRHHVGAWLDGLALSGVAVGVGALVSRCLPGLLPEGGLADALPSEAQRLSAPIGYWNGLATVLALTLPLVLRGVLLWRKRVARAFAVAMIPVLAAGLYLTSSRAGVTAALLGIAVLLICSQRRWSAAVSLGLGIVASAVTVALLMRFPALVNGPLGTERARSEGERFLPVLVGICAATGLIFVLVERGLTRVQPTPVTKRLLLARVPLVVVAGVLVVGAASLNLLDRARAFREPLGTLSRDDYVNQHLASTSSNGRWQLWNAAVDQWEASPLRGQGAGSFGRWWTQHGSLNAAPVVRYPHSLYLESLGELGVVGLALLLSFVGAALVGGIRSTLRSSGWLREEKGAALGVFVAFALAVGVDWTWHIPAVGAIGLVAAAGATVGPVGHRNRHLLRLSHPLGILVGIASLVAAALLLSLLLSALQLDASRQDARSQRWSSAEARARRALQLSPWATSPRVQLALINEARGRPHAALAWIEQAMEQDAGDWQTWVIKARIQTSLGDQRGARQSLDHAVALNPRSQPLRQLRKNLG
jgi:hypothetical protein